MVKIECFAEIDENDRRRGDVIWDQVNLFVVYIYQKGQILKISKLV